MNEKLIERKLKKEVEKISGLAIKFTSPYFTGLPDRVVMLPGRKFFWVETKSTGDKMSKRQQLVRKQLLKMGFEVEVIDDQQKLDDFLNRIRK